LREARRAAELKLMSVPEPGVSAEAASAPARSREATRRRLLDAGTALFARHGLHGATSAQVARRAGVATGTFYLHFRDKEELFRAIVFDALARLRERQERAGAAHARGSRAELRARTAELLAFAEEESELIRVVFGRGGESATLGEEVLDAIVPGIARRLDERRAAGATPPDLHPAVAAQALAAMTVRVIAWWIDHRDEASAEQVADTLLRMHPAVPA
jgi:AcrR family transcriptional regulator